MRKIFTIEEKEKMKSLYLNDFKSTGDLSDIFGVSKPTINKILRDYGVNIRNVGSIFLGGKLVADKKYYIKNKNKIDTYRKSWASDNRGKLDVYHKEWRDNNRESLNESKRIYEKIRKDSDPNYKFAAYTRTAIWETLKTKRGTGIFKHMDYTVKELMHHIESLFTDGMTWGNYGDWHLDHIVPIISFNFNSFEDSDFKKCWALSNLQPLWSTSREINGVFYLGNLNKNSRF